eukprot:UN24046
MRKCFLQQLSELMRKCFLQQLSEQSCENAKMFFATTFRTAKLAPILAPKFKIGANLAPIWRQKCDFEAILAPNYKWMN